MYVFIGDFSTNFRHKILFFIFKKAALHLCVSLLVYRNQGTSQCPRVLGFKCLGFLRDGFGVKEKKKAGTGVLCPTVTGTH
jgi:hypothetical protein